MIPSLRFAFASILLAATVAACGGGNGTASTNNAGGTSSAGGSGTGGEGAGIGVVGCNPACTGTQRCSAAGTCIDAGTCLVKGDCNAGLTCDPATHTCVPDSTCGAMTTSVAPVPPNLLIVLDRSCSMTENVAGVPKWTLAVNAIDKMTTDFAGQIRFGLTLFPDLVAPNCDQGAVPIPVGDANEGAIQSLLMASLVKADPYYPDGPCVTNIDAGIHQATLEPAFTDTTRQSYVLLVTDGAQSSGCTVYGSDNGTTQMIGDLYTNQKVSTFVLGFGGAVDANQLNKFADAGGVPTGDPTAHFYKAEDAMSLETALSTIAAKTLSCTFTLMDTPPDPAEIYVFVDASQDPLARDPSHMAGWDYDAATNQITFYGATCDMLKAGTFDDVHVVFGCGGSTG